VVIVTGSLERDRHPHPGTVPDELESQDIAIESRRTREVRYPKVHVTDSDRSG
jgi:hypothetical protein